MSKSLDRFGQTLMAEVRDEAINKFEMIVEGKMKSSIAKEMHAKLSCFNDEQKAAIRDVVVGSIDDVIYNFLSMAEQNEENIKLMHRKELKFEDLAAESDDLSGEIYTEDGWIARFSQYKENFN